MYPCLLDTQGSDTTAIPLDRMASIAEAIITVDVISWQKGSEEQLSDLKALFLHDDPIDWKDFRTGTPRISAPYIGTESVQFYGSAVSQALSFIESIPRNQQLQLHHLVFQEGARSVAMPECHLQGIIPFVEKSHVLRSERRIDLDTVWVSLSAIVIHN